MLGFVARVEGDDTLQPDPSEIEEARWFTRDQLREAVDGGEVHIPRSVSISSSLLAHWYGGPLPGTW
jgi:NAD+ diphosphatase